MLIILLSTLLFYYIDGCKMLMSDIMFVETII